VPIFGCQLPSLGSQFRAAVFAQINASPLARAFTTRWSCHYVLFLLSWPLCYIGGAKVVIGFIYWPIDRASLQCITSQKCEPRCRRAPELLLCAKPPPPVNAASHAHGPDLHDARCPPVLFHQFSSLRYLLDRERAEAHLALPARPGYPDARHAE
jgi:hypothetical protein